MEAYAFMVGISIFIKIISFLQIILLLSGFIFTDMIVESMRKT